MKAVVVYASARRNGFSSLAADVAAESLESAGAEVQRFYLHRMNYGACKGCFRCREKEGCVLEDDMTALFDSVIESDFVVFASPIYCFQASSEFNRMFERLYPMLGGGPAASEGPSRYSQRYPHKRCMLILSQGAPKLMCLRARKQIVKNLKMNGFDNLGTVVVDGTYLRKERKLTERETKALASCCEDAARVS